MYTCCPHCQTCFRITKAQLDVAQGKVRCGHCKQVFNGKQHLRDELPGQSSKPVAPVTKAPPPTSTPVITKSEPLSASKEPDKSSDIDFDLFDLSTIPASHPEDEAWLEEDDASLSDLDESETDDWLAEDEYDEEDVTANLDEPYDDSDELYDEFEEDEDEEELDIEPEAEIPAPEAEPATPSRYAYVDPEELRGEQQDIEKFIEEMNAQLTEAVEKPINIRAFDSAVDVDLSLPAEAKAEAPEKTEQPLPTEKKPAAKPAASRTDEDFKRAFLDNLDSTLALQPTAPAEPSVAKPPPKPATKPQAVKEKPAPPPPRQPGRSAQQGEAIPLRLRDSLAVEVKPRRPVMLVLGGLGILLFSALLVIQLAFFRSSQLLDRFPAMQPLVEHICAELPCRYSGPRDVSQIKLLNRDIRLHPKVNNALLISATFINRAPFKQPYPDITVSLSDLSGALVAQRRFTPAEYLGRLNSPFILMPSNKPVQIALEVVDPGRDAVNFEFAFE